MNDKISGWQQNAELKQHGHTDWRHAVEKLLGDADFDSTLIGSTFDNIKIQPLYLQQTDAPFIGRGEKPWSIQQTYHTGSPSSENLEEINQSILADLSNGVNSIELQLATTEVNTANSQSAIACYTYKDLEQLLAGVRAEMIQLSLTPGTENRLTGALLLAYCHRQKTAPEAISCALNIDPLNSLAQKGQCAKTAMASLAQYASYCANQFPNSTSLCVDTSTYHNAGCTESQEIAYCLATTVEYLRALQSLPADTAFTQMRYRVAIDNDFFLNIAKLRATRELLRQIQENCGAASPAKSLIDAVSGFRALTTLDQATNILRISTHAAAAMTSGANGFNCTPYNHLTDTSAKAIRLARNTHHVLIEESGLLKVQDPARGSGYIEALTQGLCESAWTLFQEIESTGGMHKALSSGLIAEQIKQSCKKRTAALSTGTSKIIGVTEFADPLEIPTPTTPYVLDASGLSGANSVSGNNTKTATESVIALVNALSDGGSTLDHTHHCTAEITIQPIESFRDAELFENLRLRSHAYKTANGNAPEITLLTIGSQKDFTARAGFCKNFFAVAGITTRVQEIDEFLQEASNNYYDSIFVLCSSDKHYLKAAEKIAGLHNVDNLWIAGNNPKTLTALKGKVSEALHLHCDKAAVLQTALRLLGVPA